MKKFSLVFKYLAEKKANIALYFLFNLLSIVFSLVSLAMLAPFLQLLFGLEKLMIDKPVFEWTASSVLDQLKYQLSELINQNGPVAALAAICITVIVSIFFKNLFFTSDFACSRLCATM